ncbi:GNAT family N-acetyltransferase [Sediminibacillus massiliensis]|uniref:GNAT family N-acetyltransferase n=1 Tax=Sediminibacillus massiliensis TaxID=1926277 RepID=UPI00318432F2
MKEILLKRMENVMERVEKQHIIKVCKATPTRVQGIAKVCIDANWSAYRGLCSDEYINSIITEFYNHERILKEVKTESKEWGGYFVALEDGKVVGAGGGGLIDDSAGEIYVLYISPGKRKQGIGTLLLDAITNQQKSYGASEQWVSVLKGNEKGILFYKAKRFSFEGEEQEDEYPTLRFKRPI